MNHYVLRPLACVVGWSVVAQDHVLSKLALTSRLPTLMGEGIDIHYLRSARLLDLRRLRLASVDGLLDASFKHLLLDSLCLSKVESKP